MRDVEAESSGTGRGLFLVLEGVEGAGKSTQARLLSDWLQELGVPHTSTREPGGTGLGEAVRSLVLEREDLSVPLEAELFLILAARAAFVREVVKPALERGRVVVSDRYDLSTFAYQGWGRGLPMDQLRALNAFATGGLVPDLYLLFEVSVGEGQERQRRQGKGGDKIEREGASFLERVREGYLALAAADARIQGVDASGAEDLVHERVRELLRARYPETFGAGEG